MVQEIGTYAFYGASALISVEIPTTVTKVETNAFSNSALATVTYKGTQEPAECSDTSFTNIKTVKNWRHDYDWETYLKKITWYEY